MQRVRIGLTGLAFVFVLVLLGAVFRSASDEQPITANSIEQQGSIGNPRNGEEAEPTEPLAELGVAPGNADSNSSTDAVGQRGR
ncbi:MAG: hypothetical protein JWN69_514 [Alphaproteobacteria bacterium]|nr:hypothetical protein [Alphaproteobacteria bacterium]